jgi:hypothetical protein
MTSVCLCGDPLIFNCLREVLRDSAYPTSSSDQSLSNVFQFKNIVWNSAMNHSFSPDLDTSASSTQTAAAPRKVYQAYVHSLRSLERRLSEASEMILEHIIRSLQHSVVHIQPLQHARLYFPSDEIDSISMKEVRFLHKSFGCELLIHSLIKRASPTLMTVNHTRK